MQMLTDGRLAPYPDCNQGTCCAQEAHFAGDKMGRRSMLRLAARMICSRPCYHVIRPNPVRAKA